jgi:hypothetical protein
MLLQGPNVSWKICERIPAHLLTTGLRQLSYSTKSINFYPKFAKIVRQFHSETNDRPKHQMTSDLHHLISTSAYLSPIKNQKSSWPSVP